jgi:hypothetical protein
MADISRTLTRLTSTLQCIEAAVQQAGINRQQVVSVGITRERLQVSGIRL